MRTLKINGTIYAIFALPEATGFCGYVEAPASRTRFLKSRTTRTEKEAIDLAYAWVAASHFDQTIRAGRKAA